MSDLLRAALLTALEPTVQALAVALVGSIPVLVASLYRFVMAKAAGHTEAGRQGALARLVDIAGRSAEQLLAAVLADPTAAAALAEAKAMLVRRMAVEVHDTLNRIGGSASGVEQLILGQTATKLRELAPNLSEANLAAAAAALARLGGLTAPVRPAAGLPARLAGAL